MKNILLAIVMVCAFCWNNALAGNVDSLRSAAFKEKIDSLRMNTLEMIGTEYYRAGNFDSSLFYFDKSIKTAISCGLTKKACIFICEASDVYLDIPNLEMAIAMIDSAKRFAIFNGDLESEVIALIYEGKLLNENDRLGEAIVLYKDGIELTKGLSQKSWLSTIYNNLSMLYRKLGDEEISTTYLIKSIEIREEMGSPYLGVSYANLANTFKRQENYDEAIKGYLKSLKMLEGGEFTTNRIICLRNLGDAYTLSSKYNKARKLLKESRDLGLTHSNSNMSTAMYHFLMATLHSNQQDIDSVLIQCNKADELLSEKESPYLLSALNLKIADAHYILGKKTSNSERQHIDLSIKFGEKSMENAQITKSFYLINKIAQLMMRIYGRSKDAEKTLEYAELYGSSLDSLNKIEHNKKVIAMQTKFDVGKKS